MPEFPQKESEVIALADALWKGILGNGAIYPAPPVHPMTINSEKNTFIEKRNDAIQLQAESEIATAAKDEALADLVDAMKDDLRYAEYTVDFDDAKLQLIGWGGRGGPTPTPLPGQPRLLEAAKQGEGWLTLDWKQPAEGGRPTVYMVMRRERPDGPWENVAAAVETEITLTSQPRLVELEYRIISASKAGESEPSNTVMAVL